MIKGCAKCNAEFESIRSTKYCSLECALMARVHIPIDKDQCWEWTGPVGSHGYGAFSVQGKHFTTHRASYMVHRGEIPDLGGGHGGVVMHKCDNRTCCNPSHLVVGTQKENLSDAWSKKRMVSGGAKGEKSRTAILTQPQVIEIRNRLNLGETGASLSKEFLVTQSAISRIRLRKNWKHI